MGSLKHKLLDLVSYFNTEKIIEVDINTFDDKTIYESVKLLKEIFENKFFKTKLSPMMKGVHYANGFKDEDLKQSAYLLDEIQQYLTINKFLNHNCCVEFFNKKITTKGFVITPEILFKTHLESLLLSESDNEKENKMRNQELQNLVQLEIKNRESVSDIIGMNIMKRVLFELQNLEKKLRFQLTYSKMLVDSCDFNDDLVNKLIEYAYFINKRK